MSLLAYWQHQRALAKRRRQLKDLDKWIHDLEDQVHSGEEALKRARAKRVQLQARLDLLTPVQDIIEVIGT